MKGTMMGRTGGRRAGALGRIVASLAVALAVAACPMAAVAPAYADGATVTTTIEGGTLNPDGDTVVDVSGSGFQDVQGGFGGIYVLFGWVDDPSGGTWKPSQGGKTGENYRYVPDDENNPTGYDVFVAFTGDPTASAANGGSLSPDGTWSAKITVPGAKFTSYDRSGNPADVDCTQVQCGIITIGAHGVVNTTNETFTPLTFGQASSGDTAASSTGGDAQQSAASGSTASGSSATGSGTTANRQSGTAAGAATNAASGTASQAAGVTTAATPTLGIAGWLIVASLIVFGIALIVLAAGIGGYYATKSLLLGVSPAALDKEIARRERRADQVRAREELKAAKRRRKQAERLAKANARADQARSFAGMDGADEVTGVAGAAGGAFGEGGAVPMRGVGRVVRAADRAATAGSGMAGDAESVGHPARAVEVTQVLQPVAAVPPSGEAPADSIGVAGAAGSSPAGVGGHANPSPAVTFAAVAGAVAGGEPTVPARGAASSIGLSTGEGLRGFFRSHVTQSGPSGSSPVAGPAIAGTAISEGGAA